MDKTSGFALIGFLCIVLGFGFSQAMAGGGGGGGGGNVCSMAVSKLRQCLDEMLSQVPEAYRDEAAARLEEQMSDAYGDCMRELDRKPESAARVQGCLQVSSCEAFFHCL